MLRPWQRWTTIPFRPHTPGYGAGPTRPCRSLVPADSLWVDDGPLAGHYVLLAFSHYRMTGLQTAPPDSYAGLDQLDNVVRGAKTGLAGNAITCQFVSRWDLPGTADDFSVVGPVTMVKVSP